MMTHTTRKLHRLDACHCLAFVLLLGLLALPLSAAMPEHIEVRLVTDFESGRLISDEESLQPVTRTIFDPRGTREVTIGTRATLWVRNAHINGAFFFERYYEGKYIGREARLMIPTASLEPGTHAIEPGNHAFTLHEDGRISSDDPDIHIDGATIMLRCYPVDIHPVDGARQGPSDLRLVPAQLGLFAMTPEYRVDAESLPDPRRSRDLRDARSQFPIINLISHSETFYPLRIWLPSNEVGQGYLLYPSWQSFHLGVGGNLDLSAGGAPAVPGISAEETSVVIPHRRFQGDVHTYAGLSAGVGNVALGAEMLFGATLAPVRFRAGHGQPVDDFYLRIDTDFTQRPHKYFVADNMTPDPTAIRLLAIEWQHPVWTRGSETTLSVRFLDTPEKTSMAKPTARLRFSPYDGRAPARRVWEEIELIGWENGRESGSLTFRVPDRPFGFGIVEIAIVDADNPAPHAMLAGEVRGCIVEPGQLGTASIITHHARDAFVAGEEIVITLMLRSDGNRPSGRRQVVLTDPRGGVQKVPIEDSGQATEAFAFTIPADRSRNLQPGRYTLSVDELPDHIVGVPFQFDLAASDPTSEFLVIKPSKYTKAMNNLVPSHYGGNQVGPPVDLDRAVQTMHELGYNRIDLMTYVTNHHLRTHTWREPLAQSDPRLPPGGAVFTPKPRHQLLNAATRYGLEFSDVFLSYNDFHLPRNIEGYTQASQRWLARELQDMRGSPAMDGMMLYDEMYDSAVSGLVEGHQKLWNDIRHELATEALGQSPAKIEESISRYMSRPASQRDPKALQDYIGYENWLQLSWQAWVDSVVTAGREVTPGARFGTFRRTWMGPGNSDNLMHGYPPDLFSSLDIISHVHYSDNSTCWVHVPMIAQLQRTDPNKKLYVNLPVTHESRTQHDGQFQRKMAFALLAQGANGISMWGVPHSFDDGPNRLTLIGNETTRHLNREILQPFGDVLSSATNGYRRVGIVSTLGQHATGSFKEIHTSHQTEEIWVACWRLGYPAVFVREQDFAEPLEGYDVLFVPGVRFAGELSELMLKRLEEAIAAGIKVVVEKGSELDLAGIIRCDDWPLNSFYLGKYFPTWMDDELNKVYEHSQPSTDYLRGKFAEWGVEPAARGPFRIGPSWRDGGDIQYLVMANFDYPDYPHTVRQQMSKPLFMPLEVEAVRGQVAYDLLASQRLALEPSSSDAHQLVTLDMTRGQGALVAFLPEPIERLRIDAAVSEDGTRVRIRGTLLSATGAIDGTFPVRIQCGDQTFYRTLGPGREAVLPTAAQVEVTELIAGTTTRVEAGNATPQASPLVQVDLYEPRVPYPAEVGRFLQSLTTVRIVPGDRLPAARQAAETIAGSLRERGVEVEIVLEADAWSFPKLLVGHRDPYENGFHSWRGRQELIGPAIQIDKPVILIASPGASYLLDELSSSGFLTEPPFASPGEPIRPSLQLAQRAFHPVHGTLCLIASNEQGVRALTGRLRQPFTDTTVAPELRFVRESTSEGAVADAPALTPVREYLGTNEMIAQLDFDTAGNLYLSTWGHGANLYSLSPAGELRFSKYLPQMGIRQMRVEGDRILAYTAAGARLYQLDLDGNAVSQVRLNMDPGSTHYRDEYGLSSVNYVFLRERGEFIHLAGDRMRRLNTEMEILAEWTSETFVDKDVSDEEMSRGLHSFAVSPDGQRLAQLESSSYFYTYGHEDRTAYDLHLVIRDLDGKLLHEYRDISNTTEPEEQVEWPAGAPGPIIRGPGVHWQFDGELQVVEKLHGYTYEFYLGTGRRLMRDGQTLRFVRDPDVVVCRVGPFAIMPTVVAISADEAHLATLDEKGGMHLYALADGRRLAQWTVSEVGTMLRFMPDNQGLVLGGIRGGVQRVDLAGQPLWSLSLGDFNDVLGQELPLWDAAITDYTEKIWPVKRDEPGELEELVRLGENRLTQTSYRVGESMVGESITQYLGRHVTWILEFRYKAVDSGQQPTLIAGIRSHSRYPDSTGRRYQATDAWQFARLAMKNGIDCSELAVGFSSRGGEILIEDASFRLIRFPSVNHLLYEPLHAVRPVVLTNPLFLASYDPFGNLREEAPNRAMIAGIRTGTPNLAEAAFLQNGRINDMHSKWYVQPFQDIPYVSLALQEPRWVSMVVLYFNAYDAANVTPHFDILVTDMETQKELVVASIRHNGQLFRIVKFPPIQTPQVKVRMVNSIRRLRTLTEVELYGPLSGQEGAPGFADAEGQNTYMGDFSRVDKRAKSLAASYEPPVLRRHNHGESEMAWNPPLAQILVSDERFYVSRALGLQDMYELADPLKTVALGRANGIGFTPFGAYYGGLLLRPGNDGSLYCISPESGTTLWSVKLGERLFGCPVAIREDVYMANESGRLYQLDLANGSIMRDAEIDGGVFGSLATDGSLLYMITDAGKLLAYRTGDLTLAWEATVAPYSESTPAVDKGVVYAGDQQGVMRAFNAATGEVLWQTPLGQEFTRCPVVVDGQLVVGMRGGLLAVLDRATGKLLWSRQVKSRFSYEPMVLGDQILYFEGSLAHLIPLAGGEPKVFAGHGYDRRERENREFPFTIEDDPVLSLTYYKEHIFAVPRHADRGHTIQQINYAWHTVGGRFYVMTPTPPADADKETK